jgi:hypothetical protein
MGSRLCSPATTPLNGDRRRSLSGRCAPPGVRSVPVNCCDHHCSHWVRLGADRHVEGVEPRRAKPGTGAAAKAPREPIGSAGREWSKQRIGLGNSTPKAYLKMITTTPKKSSAPNNQMAAMYKKLMSAQPVCSNCTRPSRRSRTLGRQGRSRVHHRPRIVFRGEAAGCQSAWVSVSCA